MRKEVLSRFQAEAADLFSRIKKEDKNLFDYQASLLILLSHIPTTSYFKEILKLEIVRIVDLEIALGLSTEAQNKNGLLSQQQEQSVNQDASRGTREEKNDNV